MRCGARQPATWPDRPASGSARRPALDRGQKRSTSSLNGAPVRATEWAAPEMTTRRLPIPSAITSQIASPGTERGRRGSDEPRRPRVSLGLPVPQLILNFSAVLNDPRPAEFTPRTFHVRYTLRGRALLAFHDSAVAPVFLRMSVEPL